MKQYNHCLVLLIPMAIAACSVGCQNMAAGTKTAVSTRKTIGIAPDEELDPAECRFDFESAGDAKTDAFCSDYIPVFPSLPEGQNASREQIEDLINLQVKCPGQDEERARRAFDAIEMMGENVLPVLIDHLGDDREAGPFVYSIAGKLRVSYVCADLVAAILGYRGAKPASFSPCYPSSLEHWYRERRDWSLNEMQGELTLCNLLIISKGMERDSFWSKNEDVAQKTIGELEGKVQESKAATETLGFAWEQPPILSEQEVVSLAKKKAHDEGYKWDEYSVKEMTFDKIVDTWVVFMERGCRTGWDRLWVRVQDDTKTVEIIEGFFPG